MKLGVSIDTRGDKGNYSQGIYYKDIPRYESFTKLGLIRHLFYLNLKHIIHFFILGIYYI